MRDESWRCVKVSLAFYQAGGYYVDIFFSHYIAGNESISKAVNGCAFRSG